MGELSVFAELNHSVVASRTFKGAGIETRFIGFDLCNPHRLPHFGHLGSSISARFRGIDLDLRMLSPSLALICEGSRHVQRSLEFIRGALIWLKSSRVSSSRQKLHLWIANAGDKKPYVSSR